MNYSSSYTICCDCWVRLLTNKKKITVYTIKHISYVYLYIRLVRQCIASTIEAIFYSGCGRVVEDAGHKAGL